MAHVYYSKVRETSTTTGTGTFALAGAVNGHRTFGSLVGVGETFDYHIAFGTSWEIGIGTLASSTTFTRTQVRSSSNSNAAVNFGAGTKDVSLIVSGRQFDAVFGHSTRGHRSGLILSNNGGVSSGTLAIASGQAASNAAPYDVMTLASGFTKTTSAWAAGSGNGGLDTGSIGASTWYYIWLIGKWDDTVDVLISASATSPTMPSGYVFKRRIGSVRTNGSSQWPLFVHRGKRFLWAAPTSDLSTTPAANTPANVTVSVPPGIPDITAHITAISGLGATTQSTMYVYSPLLTDSSVGLPTLINTANGPADTAMLDVLVNTSAQVRYMSVSGGIALNLYTRGWTDEMGEYD